MRTDTFRRCWLRLLLGALTALLLIAPAQLSFASSSYPPRLKSRWAVSGKLPGGGQDGCTLCHSKDAGGAGTATKAFAQTLRTKYGLSGADIDSLDYALEQSRKQGSDSDRDSFSDYDELSSFGTDPNDAKSYPIIDEPIPGAAAGASSSSGGAGPDVASSGGAASAGGSVDEPEPWQCTPSGPTLPLAQYGCQFRAGVPENISWLAGPLALAWVMRRTMSTRRIRRTSREPG